MLPVHNRILSLLLTVFLLGETHSAAAQQDTTHRHSRKKSFFNNIFDQVRGAVTISKKDSLARTSVLNTKSESVFNQYNGKIIRNIQTKVLGFERTFKDTTRINYLGARILNTLHVDTKDWVIKNNLFFGEGSVLNAYIMSDNERYLRSLEFIQDARILVLPVGGKSDSVDIQVVTKDLFSITGSIDVNGIKRVRTKIAESNLMGMGQKLQFTALADKNRYPGFGYEWLFTKSSIGNTFINVSLGYTVINTGPRTGTEDEKAFYIKAERTLVSPYSRMAGGLVISYNHSENYYHKPDSLFYQYRYNLYDAWAGYNLGVTKLLRSKTTIRDRSFLAFRYLSNHFNRVPVQIGKVYDPVYNTRKGLLTELTLFRQDFYKTNYIYGFGTTEDIPYGFNIALTGGWYKQLNLGRVYAGINFNQFMTTKNQAFIHYYIRSGGFLNKNKWQDATILTGANVFSKIYLYHSLKLREYLRFSYTRLINRLTLQPLRIDNPFGLQSFSSDSALGNQRLSLYAETFMFTTVKVLGFQMAPFLFADLSWLAKDKHATTLSGFYSGLGGGIRTRNENLIFGTIELKAVYFPNRAEKTNRIKVTVTSNIRFRYNSRYIKAPDFIQTNTEDLNDVYGSPR